MKYLTAVALVFGLALGGCLTDSDGQMSNGASAKQSSDSIKNRQNGTQSGTQ